MNAVDYVILACYLLIVLGVGWSFRVRRDRGDDYFLASRSMGWFPIGLSVMVTVFSAINYLALPNEVFGYGLYVIVALPVFFLAAWPITKIWMPFFHSMKLTSAYEYLERRFDKRVRSFASGLFILWRFFWMATALFASARIMALLTGVSPVIIIVIGGITATVYTFLGGIKAVMWTDVLQFFVLFGSISMGIVFAMGDGNISDIIGQAFEGGRLKPFAPFDPAYFSLDPRIRMTFWSGLIGVFVAFLSRYGADQVVMQRYFSARNLRMAQRGLWLNAGASVVSLSILVFFGLAVYAYAMKSGSIAVDWEHLTMIQKKNIGMKNLAGLIRSFPAGITGLTLAGLLAATMSSIDSGINSCSTAFVVDFYKQYRKGKADDILRFEKGITLGIGIITTLLALTLIPLVGKTNSLFMIVNKLINGLGSPLLALIVLGMFNRKVNAPGMFYGSILGLLGSLTVSFFVKPLALQYYAVLNFAVCVTPCVLFSFIAEKFGFVQTEEKTDWVWFAWKKRTDSMS